MFEKFFLKSRAFIIALMSVTALGITLSGILLGQKLVMMLPLYVSLFVMILNSQALRIGILIGGINSILYAVVYFILGLYASAVSALVMNFPFQIATFILWSRRKDGDSTKFRSLGTKWSILTYVAIAVAYVPLLLINMNAGGAHAVVDTAISVLSFAVTILTVFAFVEYTYISILQNALCILLYALMVADAPEQTCYLVYAVYSLICVIRGAINIHKIYAAQKSGDSSAREADTAPIAEVK